MTGPTPTNDGNGFYFFTLCAMPYACLPAPVPTEGGAGRRHAIFQASAGRL